MAESPEEKKRDIITELMAHYKAWTEDNMIRMTRKHGWNEITDAYYGKLPEDWPFTSRVTDPRIHTTLIEKNARLVNGKLKGRLVPREGNDMVGASISNAVLDYQWETANEGGSMHSKVAMSDLDSRLYGTKYALVTWKYEESEDGKVLFDGNEMYPLDLRDCGMDYAASHIRNAKWFQHRSWEFVEDLEKQVDAEGNLIFTGMDKIKHEIIATASKGKKLKSSRKDNTYTSRVKQLRGLEDRTGTDMSFPMIEVVTEYREDRWVTFSPEYKVVMRDIPNPYKHRKIPVAQLRYYPLQDDPIGESEVESVLPIWLSIQATVCAYLDEVMMKIRPPLKIIEGAVRVETIQYGPEAQWLMTRPDAITEMQSNGEATRYFETTYSALVSAFNTAMGDMSQGVSGVDPFSPDKTATEVRKIEKQQNARDEKNQSELAEFIKDIMLMWCSNNKQFLFSNPKKQEFLVRIIGQDKFNYLERSGLAETELPDEAYPMLADQIAMQGGDVSDTEMMSLVDAGSMPRYPVIENPNEKDPEKLIIKPKMKISDMGDVAEVVATPEDLEGLFDYVADVKSMSMGASQELMQGRQRAIELLTANPTVLQLLQQEGWTPKIKEIISANLEDLGLKDSDRFFEKLQTQVAGVGQDSSLAAGIPGAAGVQPPQQEPGLPAMPQTVPGAGLPQQMA